MPKSIVREFDNSTTGITLAAEFAVAVPGFASVTMTDALKKEAIAEGVICDAANPDILKLTSRKQFIKYVGKFDGTNVATNAAAPQPKQFLDGASKFEREYVQLLVSDFVDENTNDFYEGYHVYEAEEIEAGDDEELYGTVGWRLISYTPAELPSSSAITRTFRLSPVSLETLRRDIANEDGDGVTKGKTVGRYFMVADDKQGNFAISTPHLGNRIAYMLLDYGYPIYYKKLVIGRSIIAQLSEDDFWAPFKNKVTYPIRYLMSGGVYDATVNAAMTKIAAFQNEVGTEADVKIEDADIVDSTNGRGDCIALLDIDEEGTGDYEIVSTSQRELVRTFGKNIEKALSVIGKTSDKCKYAAIFGPRVVYNIYDAEYDGESSEDCKFPASFHYLICAANAQSRYAEWYAVAGYTRGESPLSIKYTTYTFGEIAINTLAPRKANSYTSNAANLILSERGNYYLWGNRTALKIEDDLKFSHFLNIRQLCATLKKTIFQASRKFTFDPNSDLLWINFVKAIKPTLERMAGDQGIKGYLISKVATDRKALLLAKIRIIPIEAVEDFDLSIYLEPSLSGIIMNADEQVAE